MPAVTNESDVAAMQVTIDAQREMIKVLRDEREQLRENFMLIASIFNTNDNAIGGVQQHPATTAVVAAAAKELDEPMTLDNSHGDTEHAAVASVLKTQEDTLDAAQAPADALIQSSPAPELEGGTVQSARGSIVKAPKSTTAGESTPPAAPSDSKQHTPPATKEHPQPPTGDLEEEPAGSKRQKLVVTAVTPTAVTPAAGDGEQQDPALVTVTECAGIGIPLQLTPPSSGGGSKSGGGFDMWDEDQALANLDEKGLWIDDDGDDGKAFAEYNKELMSLEHQKSIFSDNDCCVCLMPRHEDPDEAEENGAMPDQTLFIMPCCSTEVHLNCISRVVGSRYSPSVCQAATCRKELTQTVIDRINVLAKEDKKRTKEAEKERKAQLKIV
jgi:hypothetical protein